MDSTGRPKPVLISSQVARYLFAILLTGTLSTCAPSPEPSAESEHEDHGNHDEHDDHEEGIRLSPEQIAAMDIRFGTLREMKLNDYLTATGSLGLPPNAYASVSARASGFVRDVANYVEGDYVEQGAVLGYLENPDFIDLQQRYLEVKAELQYLTQDLARQQQLYADSAGVLNTVQQLESRVAARRATLAGLRERLEYLGMQPDGVTPESIQQRITVFSPRSGYITTISLHDGMYVEPSTQLMELIDEEHLHLELDVFERDIGKVEKGQRVTYRIPSLSNEPYTAEIHVIGKEFNAENKTVRVHAHLQGEQPPFIRDRFAEARIWLDDATVTALPEGAVVREGELHYVYAADSSGVGALAFTALRVNPGVTEAGYTAVRFVDPLPEGVRLVTEGAYFVQAQAMASELAHEH
ncbi:cobalt-zinc-cadmium efflux system membrane fusion protein [Neolewinella xylanilytica]|uniref:Cobalt-zinc-cadmium efflux system membrane fusion protein n=2 Tax=Neolewinella xylanilytica TaxID=1514080 RepID=A0A2S6I2C9_9BACT|nr:cobalt-zinc-cadmium efflux system membrane fusion protein [Neolewinella xylanilytica]